MSRQRVNAKTAKDLAKNTKISFEFQPKDHSRENEKDA